MSLSKKQKDGVHQRTIHLEAGPNQRLDLELTYDGQGKRELVIRELSWGNGVGWFPHKSIRLDSSQLDGLLKALCCLRQPTGLEGRCPLAGAARPGDPPQAAEIVKLDFRDHGAPPGGS